VNAAGGSWRPTSTSTITVRKRLGWIGCIRFCIGFCIGFNEEANSGVARPLPPRFLITLHNLSFRRRQDGSNRALPDGTAYFWYRHEAPMGREADTIGNTAAAPMRSAWSQRWYDLISAS